MACLRQGFEAWADSEPDEPTDDNPTDEEIALYEAAEKEHEAMVRLLYVYVLVRPYRKVQTHPLFRQFEVLEHKAQRLSSSLGVGKISDQNLANALLGFVREGIRFAFSLHENQDDLFLGARLPFLRILSK